MIIQARGEEKGRDRARCIEKGGEERTPRRNRKKPQRWEGTTVGR